MKKQLRAHVESTQASEITTKPKNNMLRTTQGASYFLCLQHDSALQNNNDYDQHMAFQTKSINTKKQVQKGQSKGKKLNFSQSNQNRIKEKKQINIKKLKINKIKQCAQILILQLAQLDTDQQYKDFQEELQFLDPLRQILVQIHKNNTTKNDSDKESSTKKYQNNTKNHFRDLVKLYAKLIQTNKQYKARFESLKRQMGKDQFKKLKQLHNKMLKFKANRHDIILYRRSSVIIRQILDNINDGSELHIQIMLSQKNKMVKSLFFQRLQWVITQIKQEEEQYIMP